MTNTISYHTLTAGGQRLQCGTLLCFLDQMTWVWKDVQEMLLFLVVSLCHPLKTSYLNSLVKATRDSTFLVESITYSNVLNIFQLGIYGGHIMYIQDEPFSLTIVYWEVPFGKNSMAKFPVKCSSRNKSKVTVPFSVF